MEPRIYLYKITFEGRPEWYWGVHKERIFNENYMGSPSKNKHFWEMYVPCKDIIQEFEYSQKGWEEALSVEGALIKRDKKNPLCLNAGNGGVKSLSKISKITIEKWKDPEFRGKLCPLISAGLREKWNRDPEYRERASSRLRGLAPIASEKALSPASAEKRLKTLALIGHQKGNKNSQYGTMWITDGTKEGTKKIRRGQEIPEGFRPGRTLK